MEQLPKIARQRLAQQHAQSEHPAADVLAGFVERSLDHPDRERVLAHLARCSECRDVVALAMPETEPADVRPERRAWYEWSLFRFGGLAAALTVIIVAVVLFRPHAREGQDASATAKPESNDVVSSSPNATEVSKAPAPGPAMRDEEKAPSGSRASQERDRDAIAMRRKEGSPSAPLEQRAEKKMYLKTPPTALAKGAVVGKISGTPQNEKQAAGAGTAGKLDGNANRAIVGGATSANIAVPKTAVVNDSRAQSQQKQQQQIQLEQNQQQQNQQQQNQAYDKIESNSAASQQASAPAAPPPQAAPAPKDQVAVPTQPPVSTTSPEVAADNKMKPAANVASGIGQAQKMSRLAGGPFTSTLQWTISAAGAVQRSTDSGAHWQDVSIAEGVTFRTLAVAGMDVWAGGSALYHTSNLGARWERVKIGNRKQPMEGEITRIELPSGTRVEIATSTGQKWVSDDSGHTWRWQ